MEEGVREGIESDELEEYREDVGMDERGARGR